MNFIKTLLGLTAILAIGLFAFFLYSDLQENKKAALTASVSDPVSNPASPSDQAVQASSTTAPSKPSLSGFKEKELQEGLDNIKAGLDLLQHPFE